MRKSITLTMQLLTCFFIYSQTTTGKVKWKSATDILYDYTGELKNGNPHGRGYAISQDGDLWIQVFGEFKDGMIDGSTVILHSTGRIVISKWKENKPEGIGVMITPEKKVEYGNFVNGSMDGQVVKVYDDNMITIDNIKGGKSNGRVISVNADGNIMSDIIYANGEANGPGYQYEVESKQLFEGVWENDKWVKAATGNYPSFMRNSNFGSYKTDDHIMIYSSLTPNNLMRDTGFIYNRNSGQRRFGYFNSGKIESGVTLIGDFRIIGQFNEVGWTGLCVLYEKDKILDFGNYTNGKANGKVVHIKLESLKIIDGFFTDDKVSGMASILEPDKSFTTGNYDNGRLNGEALVVRSSGYSTRGIYKDGSLVELKEMCMPTGQKVNIRPKDINEAVNFLLKEWENDFENIKSKELSGNIQDDYKCLYYFPDGISRIFTSRKDKDGKPHNEFSSTIARNTNYALIKTEYEKLCKQLAAGSITSLAKGKMLKLIPKINKLPADGAIENVASFFSLPAYTGKKYDPLIRVMVSSVYDGYELTVDIISKWK